MPTETVTITAASGHALAGSLEMPTGLVRGAALFAHCFTCTKQSRAAVAVSRALARRGIATLRFDFTGLGGSEGEFGRAGFSTDIADLKDSARYLIERFGGPVLLVGHSLGGAAVLSAAAGMENVAAVATIGAPSDVPHVLTNIEGDLPAIERDGEGNVTIGGRPFRIGRAFIENTRSADLLSGVSELRIPLAIFHSPLDDVVSVDHAGKLFAAAKHPKSFISLDNADHLLTDPADADFVADMIAAWSQRNLPLTADWPMPEEGVVVRTGHGRFGTEVHTGSHSFVADEPRSFGGDDTGPTPYDLLLAALGTCSAMTMQMVAQRRRWPLEGVRIHLRHESDHAKDCEDAIDGSLKVQAIHRVISFEGTALSEEQRDNLITIADKCPVHRTLEGEIHIHTARGE